MGTVQSVLLSECLLSSEWQILSLQLGEVKKGEKRGKEWLMMLLLLDDRKDVSQLSIVIVLTLPSAAKNYQSRRSNAKKSVVCVR